MVDEHAVVYVAVVVVVVVEAKLGKYSRLRGGSRRARRRCHQRLGSVTSAASFPQA